MNTFIKKIIAFSAASLFAAVCLDASACCNYSALTSSAEITGEAKPSKKLKEVTFSVHLHCENCVKKVQENISFEKGVKDLEVSLEKQSVKIVYDASKTDETKLEAAIEKLGYEAEKVETAE